MTKIDTTTGKHPSKDVKKHYRINNCPSLIRDTRRWLKFYKKDVSDITGVDMEMLESGGISDKKEIAECLGILDDYFGIIPPETKDATKVVRKEFRIALAPLADICSKNECIECGYRYSPLKGVDSCILKRPPYMWPVCKDKPLHETINRLRQMCIYATCPTCPFRSFVTGHTCAFSSIVPWMMGHRIWTAIEPAVKLKERRDRKTQEDDQQ